ETGKPVDGAKVEFFGWRQVLVDNVRNLWRVTTETFNENTDPDGQITLDAKKMATDRQWLITARKAKDGAKGGDRFAYLGFTGVWYGQRYDPEYTQTRVYTITDRPVYRPEQKVQFKFWLRHARYDLGEISEHANQKFQVLIHNPKGEKVFDKTLT